MTATSPANEAVTPVPVMVPFDDEKVAMTMALPLEGAVKEPVVAGIDVPTMLLYPATGAVPLSICPRATG